MRSLMIAVLVLASCGKTTDEKPRVGAVTGTWSGTWQRKEIPGGGPLVLTMGEHPTLKRVGTACPPEETPATVNISGDDVTIEIATADVTGKLSGKLTGTAMSGELVMTCKLGTGHGTWTMKAQ